MSGEFAANLIGIIGFSGFGIILFWVLWNFITNKISDYKNKSIDLRLSIKADDGFVV